MDINATKELLQCLPKDRTLYSYCRDYYAVQLLQVAAEKYDSIQRVKRSCFGRLLEKPAISTLISDCGDGKIDGNALASYWQEPGATWLMTTGIWGDRSGRYTQTSRPGFNLVLRLNFNTQHDRLLKRTIHPEYDGVFNYDGHPFLRREERPYYRETMAWARLDIDLDNDEALIEEVQSDWVRYVGWLRKRLACYSSHEDTFVYRGCETTVGQVRRYLEFTEPLLRDWSHAMLAATIRFLHVELGLHKLWFHSWETGNCLKQISSCCAPPKSLYSQLPKQFCFERTDQLPGFLDNKRNNKRLRRAKIAPFFYKLEL